MDKKSKKTFSIVKNILFYVCIIGSVIYWRVNFTPIIVSGHSMDTTLNDGMIAISKNVNKDTKINRGDIVVVNEDSHYVIKRIIGLPNEKIKCENGFICINGEKLEEDYTSSLTEDFDEVTIGENEYFIMGDNRSNSKDSRVYGAISKQQIKSSGVFVISSISKFGLVQ